MKSCHSSNCKSDAALISSACCAAQSSGRSLLLAVSWPKWDSTLTIIAGLLILIGWWLPDQWLGTLRFTADNLINIFPFIVLSAVLAAYLQAANADSVIGRALAAKPYTAIVLAAAIGTLSPFCSCGVVPLITALLVARVPLAAVMAFWVASPIMSPSMFVITLAGLGVDFAIAKTLAAISLGLLAGLSTFALQNAGLFKSFLKIDDSAPTADLSGKTVDWKIWHELGRKQVFKQKAFTMIVLLMKWLTVAFILESLMVRYLPADVLSQWLGVDSQWAIPLAAFIGVPAYLNGFAAVPVVAGMVETGMSWGAALTFMLAGAVTSLPAAIAVYSIVKLRLFAWYVVIALVGSMLLGWVYQGFLNYI